MRSKAWLKFKAEMDEAYQEYRAIGDVYMAELEAAKTAAQKAVDKKYGRKMDAAKRKMDAAKLRFSTQQEIDETSRSLWKGPFP